MKHIKTEVCQDDNIKCIICGSKVLIKSIELDNSTREGLLTQWLSCDTCGLDVPDTRVSQD